MRFLHIVFVKEPGSSIQNREQDKREVVCNESVGGPFSFKEDSPATRLYHTRDISEEECGKFETLTMHTTKQEIIPYQAA
jgi:hypothetical protein